MSTPASSSDGAGAATGVDSMATATGALDTGPTQPAVTPLSTSTTSASTTTDPDDAGPDDDPDDGPFGWDCGSQAPPGTQTHCTGAQCDVFAQNCGGDRKCVPYRTGKLQYSGTNCVDVGSDPGFVGDVCSIRGGLDGCDFGLMCYFVNADTDEGICTPLCEGTQDEPVCAGRQAACLGEVPVCLAECDPLAPDACGAGESCACPSADSPCLCVQQALLPSEYPQACEMLGECADGLACAPGENLDCMWDSCCTPYCDLMAPNICPDLDAGQTCTPLFERDGIGICTF